MSGVSGGDGITRIREQIRSLGTTALRKIRKQLGATALAEVDKGFSEQRAPDGTPWAPSNGYGGETMSSTRRLRNSFSAQPTGDGFSIASTNVKYAAQRNYGGVIKAKNGKYLRFKVPFSVKIATSRGGTWRKLKSPGLKSYTSQWVMVKQVTQPARPMVPGRGELPDRWARAFLADIEALRRQMFGQ